MNVAKLASALALAGVLAGCGAHAASADSGAAGYASGYHRGGIMRAVQTLNLTSAQKAKVDKIVADYRAAHAKGSPRDPQAMRTERQAIMDVLTPSQRSELRQRTAQQSP
ncbi:MAG: hypothetical protein JO165_06765 [Candidatus Eremiobacteraeota bacterium]|nr:hypothetical protein [Candidatus Eremiobacteraeota bacterium]